MTVSFTSLVAHRDPLEANGRSGFHPLANAVQYGRALIPPVREAVKQRRPLAIAV